MDRSVSANEAIDALVEERNVEKPIRFVGILVSECDGLERLRVFNGGVNVYEATGMLAIEAIRNCMSIVEFGKVS